MEKVNPFKRNPNAPVKPKFVDEKGGSQNGEFVRKEDKGGDNMYYQKKSDGVEERGPKKSIRQFNTDLAKKLLVKPDDLPKSDQKRNQRKGSYKDGYVDRDGYGGKGKGRGQRGRGKGRGRQYNRNNGYNQSSRF